MNILILSAGTRDKIVQYFKEEFAGSGKVVATDCSNLAPAVYEADAFYLVPRITAPGYIDEILEICKKEKIDGVFSLIDPELSMLAKEKERFLAIGATPVISDYELVETCFDKYKMFQLLQEKKKSSANAFETAKCYLNKEDFYKAVEKGEIGYPVFVKPVRGSASIHINCVKSQEEVEVLFSLYDDLMIQEYMTGQEYGVDAYIDMISGKCTSLFLKKKIRMRSGETDKSESIKDEKLFERIREFVEDCGFRGMIDMDFFCNEETWYLSEVNPRFGGGYPHAYACKVNFPAQVKNNLEGKENPVTIGQYEQGICMMKYNEVMIRDMRGTPWVE